MSEREPSSSGIEKGGLWRIDADRLVCLEPSAVTPGTVLVPTEQVLILAVDLPLPTRAQRLAALPFALEERLAEPLDSLHLALGAELAPRRFLAGVVRRDVMDGWTAHLEAAGLGRSALVPDALTLPVPDEAAWSVRREGDRVLARTADGTGFALPVGMLATAWAGAGRPTVVSYGAALPPDLACVALSGDAFPWAERAAPAPVLDLRQGRYGPRGQPLGRMLRRLAMVVGAGAVAHAAIAAADTATLQGVARDRHERALAMIRQAAPDTPDAPDLASTLDRMLPPDGGAPGGFLPLLSRTALALRPVSSGLAVRSLSYAAGDGGLTLAVDAADMGGLQKVQGALAAAGLAPAAGAATAENGHAAGEFVVHDPGRGRR